TRAVRGRALRRAVYADDADAVRGGLPFEIHDTTYAVIPVLDGRAATDPAWQDRPVVTVQQVLSRTAVWDRGDEPMTRLNGWGKFDEYGRAHAHVQLSVARGRDPRDPGAPCLGTVTTTDYATRDDAAM